MDYLSLLLVRCSLLKQLSYNPSVGRPRFQRYHARQEEKGDRCLEKIQKTSKIRFFRRQSLRYTVSLLNDEIATLRKAWNMFYPKEKMRH